MRVIQDTTGASRRQLAQLRAAWATVVEAEGDEMEKLFKETTKHWNQNKFMGFTKEFKESSKEMVSTVGTDDQIYFYINNGTSERYAIMSPDWSSQTIPRVIGSQPGQGVVLARGKRAVPNPMPGIIARHFDEEIVKKRNPIFIKNLTAATVKVLGKN